MVCQYFIDLTKQSKFFIKVPKIMIEIDWSRDNICYIANENINTEEINQQELRKKIEP